MEQKEVVIYVRERSLNCWRTRRLLRREGYAVEVVDTTRDDEVRARLARLTGRTTVPYVFVEGRPVGGFAEIKTLRESGALRRLARGEV